MSHAFQALDFLRNQQQAMVELLKDLVLMESPSSCPDSQMPILIRLKDEFGALGYRVRLIPGRQSGGQLFAVPNGRHKTRPTQLLLGHCDTVWAPGTLKHMPFKIEGNTILGPGIYDMKSGLVQMIFALKTLQALGLSPSVDPICFINSDEEIGSFESHRYIKALAQIVDRCMVLEPSLGLSGKIKTARKGVGRFTIKVYGKAAHAGLDPDSGASAILELSHIIQKLFLLNDPEHGTSVNVGVIDGGIRANVVAPHSSAVVDVRVESQADAERVEAAIHNLKTETKGVTLFIEGKIGRPPMVKTEMNRQFWHIAKTLAGQLDIDLSEGTAGGGSDGNTTSLYTATLDGLGAVGDGAHAAHEFIFKDQLPIRCALLILLLMTPPLQSMGE